MLRIALHGGLFSGKTALADALVAESGFAKIDYTGLLKTFAAEALRAAGLEVMVPDIIAEKEKYRPFIIELGHLLDFDGGYGIDEIVALLGDLGADDRVVFDNVRTAAQWEKLEAAGFVLVRVTTPKHIRLARAKATGLTRAEFEVRMADVTEAPLPAQPYEVRLHVDGDMTTVIDDLTAKLLHAQLARKQAERAAVPGDGLLTHAERMGLVAPRAG